MPPIQRDAKDEASGDERKQFVTVVSGLPRSGTSMMMQMLAAGGMELFTDGERTADESNPRGYFELEKVKALQADNSWLDDARGRVVKVVAPLIPWLPQECDYRILFMTRELDEILASQQSMLERLKREGAHLGDDELKKVLERQQNQAKRLAAGHRVPLLEIDFRNAIDAPVEVARQVAEFLELDLDTAAMAEVIAPELYRERTARTGR
jgi:hypothetical protein